MQNWYNSDVDENGNGYEIQLDVDHVKKNHTAEDGTITAAKPVKIKNILERITSARIDGVLDVNDDSIWIYPSDRELHYHIFVRLNSPMQILERCIWQMYLRDDFFRGINGLMRAWRQYQSGSFKPGPSLLITSEPYKGFYRLPDYACRCKKKHSPEVMEICPVAKRVRGNSRCAVYFPKPVEIDLDVFSVSFSVPYGQIKVTNRMVNETPLDINPVTVASELLRARRMRK